MFRSLGSPSRALSHPMLVRRGPGHAEHQSARTGHPHRMHRSCRIRTRSLSSMMLRCQHLHEQSPLQGSLTGYQSGCDGTCKAVNAWLAASVVQAETKQRRRGRLHKPQQGRGRVPDVLVISVLIDLWIAAAQHQRRNAKAAPCAARTPPRLPAAV